MLVLPVARPPGGSRPMMLWITVFGTCQVATRSSGGCERTVPLTSTSTFGTVYDASPRTVVWNGSTSRQLRRSLIVVVVEVRRSIDHLVGRAGVLNRPAGLRPELQRQALAETRVQREIDAVPVRGALRAEVGFERDVVLRAAIGGRRRHHRQRDRVAAAARQPRILRGQDRERLVVLGPAKRVVGDLVPVEPPAVVGDLHRHARDHLLLHGDAPLPVVLTNAPAPERRLVHLREVARYRRRSSGRRRSARRTRRSAAKFMMSQSMTLLLLVSPQFRAAVRTMRTAGLLLVYSLSLVAASR